MRAWDWTITGPLKLVWAWSLRRPCNGQVRARTKSEARSLIKARLGIESLPPEVLVY